MEIDKTIMKKIQKLLTLAKDRGATEAEAKNAMAMAQRLMTKYNIEIANLGENAPKASVMHESFFNRKGSFNPADQYVMSILQQFYKVRILYSNGNDGNGIIIIGVPDDIEIAKYVHGYLRTVFFKCWNEFKNTVPNPKRASYYAGLCNGICERLRQVERETKAEETQEACKKYELVLTDKKDAINNYIFERFGRLNNSRARRTTVDMTSYGAGHAKGSTVTISKAIK